MNDTATKPAKAETIEVIIVRDYWPAGKPSVIRKDVEGNDHIVQIDIDLPSPSAGWDTRIRSGDVVTLPRKEASMLINSGAAKLPDME